MDKKETAKLTPGKKLESLKPAEQPLKLAETPKKSALKPAEPKKALAPKQADVEKKPAADAEKKPAASAEKKPAASAEKKPAASAEKKPVAKAEKKPAVKAEKKPAAKAEAKPCVPVIVAQAGGAEYDISDIAERVQADYRATHKTAARSCKIYVKPEEGMAYYVIDQTQGKISL